MTAVKLGTTVAKYHRVTALRKDCTGYITGAPATNTLTDPSFRTAPKASSTLQAPTPTSSSHWTTPPTHP